MNTTQTTLLQSIRDGLLGKWELAALTYSAECARRALIKSGHLDRQNRLTHKGLQAADMASLCDGAGKDWADDDTEGCGGDAVLDRGVL